MVAPRIVVVTWENVAFVAVSVCKSVDPSTVNVLVTVDDAVVNPPRNVRVVVV